MGVVDDDGKESIFVCRDAKFAEEMEYLKKKCDGADFIITQMFLDADVYIDFVKACGEYGINIPVVPGMAEAAKANSESDDKFKEWGIEMGAELCDKLLKAGAPGLHFYTLNLEKVVVGILLKLGLITAEQAAMN